MVVSQTIGPWGSRTFWDEYVVSVANRGAVPLVVESAGLTDFGGDTTALGVHRDARERRRDLPADVGGARRGSRARRSASACRFHHGKCLTLSRIA